MHGPIVHLAIIITPVERSTSCDRHDTNNFSGGRKFLKTSLDGHPTWQCVPIRPINLCATRFIWPGLLEHGSSMEFYDNDEGKIKFIGYILWHL